MVLIDKKKNLKIDLKIIRINLRLGLESIRDFSCCEHEHQVLKRLKKPKTELDVAERRTKSSLHWFMKVYRSMQESLNLTHYDDLSESDRDAMETISCFHKKKLQLYNID